MAAAGNRRYPCEVLSDNTSCASAGWIIRQCRNHVSRMTDEVARSDAPFTTRVRVALSIARALAAGMGHDEVTDAHVVLGIVREGENPAVAVLQHAGIALDVLRHDLEQALEPRGRARPREVARPLTDGERLL
ncbi:MAG: Clp protease N-terminal domain-containing protein, partial [Gemmatimonadota bacterium]